MSGNGGTQTARGSVTLFFSDIEGSTDLAHKLGADWASVLSQQRVILRGAIEGNEGHVEAIEGDSFFATFPSGPQALTAATTAQAELAAATWPTENGLLKVRMGLHCGMLGARLHRSENGRFVGADVHLAERVMSAAHGGEILLTAEAADELDSSTTELEHVGFHRLQDFTEGIALFHVVFAGLHADDFPPPRTPDALPTNFTVDERPLIGRDREVEIVRSRILRGASKLVTVTGPEGVGKTRLALQAVRDLRERFRGGIWLIRAEKLTNSEALLSELARALHLTDRAPEQLLPAVIRRLEGPETLLIFDHIDQLVGIKELIERILAERESVQVLVTSKVALGSDREQALEIAPLNLDAAAELFGLRAHEVDPSLNLDDEEVQVAIRELCNRLDRLPKALERAAMRLRVLTVRQLVDRLEDSPV